MIKDPSMVCTMKAPRRLLKPNYITNVFAGQCRLVGFLMQSGSEGDLEKVLATQIDSNIGSAGAIIRRWPLDLFRVPTEQRLLVTC